MDPSRISDRNGAPVRPERDFVLYWCTATRRTYGNFALDRAIAIAREHGRGVLVLEALRVDPPWASLRIHAFVADGMREQRVRYAASPIAYHAYVERSAGEGKGLVEALAKHAVAVVTDAWPCLFHPRMTEAVAARLDVRLETVDSVGLVPLAAPDKEYKRAFDFRRALPRLLAGDAPASDPLAGLSLPRVRLPADVSRRWPSLLGDVPNLAFLRALPLPLPGPVPFAGGHTEARRALDAFVLRIERYEADRNHPDDEATSGLSPWLHFGHLGTHEILAAVQDACPGDHPLFGVSAVAATFLDELVVWRELAHHTAEVNPLAFSYEGLPSWAKASLDAELSTPREAIYRLDTLAAGATADPLWNAAQRQLLAEGRIHNALRMLWGKRVIAWSRHPEEAYDNLVELNNRYAIDGRDPCSYAGIGWCFGRYDRPWPRQPIFGAVRAMTSASARRKWRVDAYVRRWTGASATS